MFSFFNVAYGVMISVYSVVHVKLVSSFLSLYFNVGEFAECWTGVDTLGGLCLALVAQPDYLGA